MGDILSRRAMLEGNCGNLLFINAIFRTFMIDQNTEFYPTYYRAIFSQKEIDYVNDNFDAFILSMADAFRDDNISYLEGITSFINGLKIPCHVIGVGLRAPYEPNLNEKRACDSAVFNFVKAVLNKSAVVGVRGEVTGAYLSKLGFEEEKDYSVIGCPSISTLLSLNLKSGGGVSIKKS